MLRTFGMSFAHMPNLALRVDPIEAEGNTDFTFFHIVVADKSVEDGASLQLHIGRHRFSHIMSLHEALVQRGKPGLPAQPDKMTFQRLDLVKFTRRLTELQAYLQALVEKYPTEELVSRVGFNTKPRSPHATPQTRIPNQTPVYRAVEWV